VIDDSGESGEDLVVPAQYAEIGGLNVEDRQRDCWNLVLHDYSSGVQVESRRHHHIHYRTLEDGFMEFVAITVATSLHLHGVASSMDAARLNS